MKTCVYELGVASKRAAGVFFLGKTTFPDFLTMSIPEIVRIVRISISKDFGDLSKKTRAEKS